MDPQFLEKLVLKVFNHLEWLVLHLERNTPLLKKPFEWFLTQMNHLTGLKKFDFVVFSEKNGFGDDDV